jgi:RNA-directed DNA polymerase
MNQNLLPRNKGGDISLEDIFLAYFDCRKNKRNKLDALEFELDFEKNLIKLWKEINDGSYKIAPLDVFISDKPVKREIFAAQFRDRIIHHLIISKLNYLFEKEFIYDTYSCRKGRGTHFGIKRVKKFMRQCSRNYKRDCYILKMDIKGYFMSINNNILLKKLENFIDGKYFGDDKEKIIWLCDVIINNDSTINCTRKSAKRKWAGLPKSKSLFYAKKDCGLPIGNYTNQVLANFYLNSLDHFIKYKLRVRYYARYVDDFLIICYKKEKLKEKIPLIEEFLNENLKLKLHPKKTYFQHHSKGVEFLGTLIKPWRSYVTSRIKNNFYETIELTNENLKEEKLNQYGKQRVLSQINSCLGSISHTNSYKLRKTFLSRFVWKFWGYFRTTNYLSKIVFNKKRKKKSKNRLSQEKRRNNKKKKRISIISIISLSLRERVSL